MDYSWRLSSPPAHKGWNSNRTKESAKAGKGNGKAKGCRGMQDEFEEQSFSSEKSRGMKFDNGQDHGAVDEGP